VLIASGPVAVASLPILLHPSVAAACSPFTTPPDGPARPDVPDAPRCPTADCSCRAE
jgi:hypothetical protein